MRQVTLNGKTYILRFTVWDQMCLEDDLGMKSSEINLHDMYMKDQVKFLRYALKDQDMKNIPDAEWDELVKNVEINEFMDAFMSILSPEEKKKVEKAIKGKN